MALIEIDGLHTVLFIAWVDLSMASPVSHNQMVNGKWDDGIPTVVDFEATSQRPRTRTQPTGLALVEQVFAAWDTIPRTY